MEGHTEKATSGGSSFTCLKRPYLPPCACPHDFKTLSNFHRNKGRDAEARLAVCLHAMTGMSLKASERVPGARVLTPLGGHGEKMNFCATGRSLFYPQDCPDKSPPPQYII